MISRAVAEQENKSVSTFDVLEKDFTSTTVQATFAAGRRRVLDPTCAVGPP
jgi:hypothetical protein